MTDSDKKLQSNAESPSEFGSASTADLARALGRPDPEGDQRGLEAVMKRQEFHVVSENPQSGPVIEPWKCPTCFRVSEPLVNGWG